MGDSRCPGSSDGQKNRHRRFRGIAYVWDAAGDFEAKCNVEMVDLDPVDTEEDIAELLELIQLHQQHTGSWVAEKVLADWPAALQQFVKVMPIDYKRALSDSEGKKAA